MAIMVQVFLESEIMKLILERGVLICQIILADIVSKL